MTYITSSWLLTHTHTHTHKHTHTCDRTFLLSRWKRTPVHYRMALMWLRGEKINTSHQISVETTIYPPLWQMTRHYLDISSILKISYWDSTQSGPFLYFWLLCFSCYNTCNGLSLVHPFSHRLMNQSINEKPLLDNNYFSRSSDYYFWFFF